MVLSPLAVVSAVIVLRRPLAIASTKVCRAAIRGMTVRSRYDETRTVALRLGRKYRTLRGTRHGSSAVVGVACGLACCQYWARREHGEGERQPCN